MGAMTRLWPCLADPPSGRGSAPNRVQVRSRHMAPVAPRSSSRIPDGGVLRLEEARQQGVNPEQSVSRQRDQVAAGGQQSFGCERPDRSLEAIQDGHAVLALEVGRPDRAELELQNELPDQLLFFGGTEG